jgi:hypothetical protein
MTEKEAAYNVEIKAIRRRASIRRSGSFTELPERVLGVGLNPITPESWELLVGSENAFAIGGIPKEKDLLNFVWFHSDIFKSKRLPLWLRYWITTQRLRNRLVPLFTIPKHRGTVFDVRFAFACGQARAIVDQTFADCRKPSDDGGDGEPVAACLAAQMADRLASEYSMPMAEVLRTPIRRLMQLARCIDYRNSNGQAKYWDREENDHDREFLKGLN